MLVRGGDTRYVFQFVRHATEHGSPLLIVRGLRLRRSMYWNFIAPGLYTRNIPRHSLVFLVGDAATSLCNSNWSWAGAGIGVTRRDHTDQRDQQLYRTNSGPTFLSSSPHEPDSEITTSFDKVD